MTEYTENLKRRIRRLGVQIVLIVVLLAAFSFLLARFAVLQHSQRVFESYSSEQRMYLFPGALSAGEVAVLRQKLLKYKMGPRGGKLRLNVSEVNYLLGHLAPLGDNFRLTLIGRDRVGGQLSLPALSNGSIRYLNGSAEFRINYRGRKPGLYVKRLVIGGVDVPEGFKRSLRDRNLLWMVTSPSLVSREVRKMLGGVQRIEIGDGWIEAIKA